MSDDMISNISKEFAKKIAKAKSAFILEELKPHFTYNENGGIEWSQQVHLRLAEYADFKRQFEQEKETLRQKLIKEFSSDGLDAGADHIPPQGCIDIVNKIFGMKCPKCGADMMRINSGKDIPSFHPSSWDCTRCEYFIEDVKK